LRFEVKPYLCVFFLGSKAFESERMLQIFGKQPHRDRQRQLKRRGSYAGSGFSFDPRRFPDRQEVSLMQIQSGISDYEDSMRRYYFDVRDGEKLQTDDEGGDYSSFEAVQDEAAMSLAELAMDTMAKRGADHRMSVEVRNERGPLLNVTCTFAFERFRQSEENQ
jgi:hypothetical protein